MNNIDNSKIPTNTEVEKSSQPNININIPKSDSKDVFREIIDLLVRKWDEEGPTVLFFILGILFLGVAAVFVTTLMNGWGFWVMIGLGLMFVTPFSVKHLRAISKNSGPEQLASIGSNLDQISANESNLLSEDSPNAAPTILEESNSLQIITWTGWDDLEILKEHDHPIDFLLYERGDEFFPKFHFKRQHKGERNGFDVLISDLLFLQRYNDAKKFANLKDYNHSKLFSLVAQPLRSKTDADCRSADRKEIFGLPVEFGISELLFNGDAHDSALKARILSNPRSLSYSDFNLTSFCANYPNAKIGLWNWYIPSLIHLLLIDKNEDDNFDLSNVHQVPVERLKKATAFLLKDENRKRFELIDDLDDITEKLGSNELDLFLGSGSSAMVYGEERGSNFLPIIPREGVVIWFNCISILSTKDARQETLKNFIRYLYECKTQLALSRNDTYRSIPVTQDGITHLMGDQNHPSKENLRRIFDIMTNLKNETDFQIGIRRLPDHWQDWQKHWEEVVKFIHS